MKIVITGSSGHLGEALVKYYQAKGADVTGVDILPSSETNLVASIVDIDSVEKALRGADAVIHSATLHKPHVTSHTKNQFVDVNIKGTQNLLEVAIKEKVKAFIFTSTTSTFGRAMTPPNQASAVWVDEGLTPIPKNIYGVTKIAAENLCQLAHQEEGLNCLILKTSRFFPEDDDMKHTLQEYSQQNLQAIEFLYRRADIQDIVEAHNLAITKAKDIGFDRFIITATTPFQKQDCDNLYSAASNVLKNYFPDYQKVFEKHGWQMFPSLDRVYSNQKAREKLEWTPKVNFREVLKRAEDGESILGPVANQIGEKGYHRKQ